MIHSIKHRSRRRVHALRRAPCLFVVMSALGCSAGGEDLDRLQDPVVFGDDDRVEYGGIVSARDKKLADSTAAQFFDEDVACAGGNCSLSTTAFQDGRTDVGLRALCSDEAFRDQLKGANCTMFLIGPKTFATAGHCMDCDTSVGTCLASTCALTRVVFGFNADADGGNEVTSVPSSDVYSCTSAWGIWTNSQDFAIVEVDRVVQGRAPLFVRHGGKAGVGDDLAVAGHPDGLPLKFAGSGELKEDLGTVNMGTSLDAFAGNSGSPVFNAATGVVEGIHVRRPYYHYLWDSARSCAETNVCSDTTGCSPNFGTSAWAQATRFPWLASQTPVPLHGALVTTTVL